MNEDILNLIEQPVNTERVLVPLDIPLVFNDEESSKAYARKFCAWTDEIITVDQDNIYTKVANPISPKLAIALFIRQDMKDKFIQLAKEQGAEQGSSEAEQRVKVAFNYR